MGPVTPGFNPLLRGWDYRLAPEEPLFRGMPMGPEAFLEQLGAHGLRSCTRTHLKTALCHTPLIGGSYVKYPRPAISHFDQPYLDEHGSGQVCPGYDGSRSRYTLTSILEPQGVFLHALTLLGCGWVNRLASEASLLKGMPTEPEAFLKLPDASGPRPCYRNHLKKAMCHTRPSGTTFVKYRWTSHCFVQRLFDGLSWIHAGCQCSTADLMPKGPRHRLGHLWVV